MKIYRSEKSKERILDSYDRLLTAWDVPVEQMDVKTRYGMTHVNAAGAANLPPLVLLHGVGDDSALMWVYNIRALSEKMRVYAIDTIGGPGRSVPDENYQRGMDDTLWLDDVLDALKLERACLAGVSHGGYLTQLYCLKRPERVVKCVCMACSVPIGNGSPMKTMMKIFLPEAAFPTKGNIRKLLLKMSGENAAAFTDNPLVFEHFSTLLKGYNNMAMGAHSVRP